MHNGSYYLAAENIDPPCMAGLTIRNIIIFSILHHRCIDFLCVLCSGINTGSNRPGTGDMIIHHPGNILLPFAQKTGNHISGRWKMVK